MESQAYQKVVLNKIVGQVSVKKNDGLIFESAKDIRRLQVGDIIKTATGTCELVLENGTILFIAPNTTLTIQRATFDRIDKSRHTLLKLDVGRLQAKVGKLTGTSTFEVSTPSALAAVRGTVLFLDAGSNLGKLFTELYVDESSGGVMFRNSRTGDQFLVPSFGASSSFSDGGLLAPHVLNEEERAVFLQRWENEINKVLQQLGIEEQSAGNQGSVPSEAEQGGDPNDASQDKKDEQNIAGGSFRDQLLSALQKYSQNLLSVGSILDDTQSSLENFLGRSFQDPSIFDLLSRDLDQINNERFGEEIQSLRDRIMAALGANEDLNSGKDGLSALEKLLEQILLDAANTSLNDSFLQRAQQSKDDFDALLVQLELALTEYNGLLPGIQDEFKGLYRDLIEDVRNRAVSVLGDLPESGELRDRVLRKARGLTELKSQNQRNHHFDEWAYDSVQYDSDSNPLGELSGNGDLGVVSLDRGTFVLSMFSLPSNTGLAYRDFLDSLREAAEKLEVDVSEADYDQLKELFLESQGNYAEFSALLSSSGSIISNYQTLLDNAAHIEALREAERNQMREAFRAEIRRIQGEVDLEHQIADGEKKMDAQTGKVFTDIHGNRVRTDQYIFRPDGDSVEILSLTLRTEGTVRGISSASFGFQFNQGLPADLKSLPWDDYLNVVTEDDLNDRLASHQNEPGYHQYIVYETVTNPAYYPTSIYAEFRNPQGGRSTSDVIRFSETYSNPFTVTLKPTSRSTRNYKVQGRTSDTTLVDPVIGDTLELKNTFVPASNHHSASYQETLKINGQSIQSSRFDTDDDQQSQGRTFAEAYDNSHSIQTYLNNRFSHPAFFENSITVTNSQGHTDYTLTGVFVPFDNNGNVIDAEGFQVRGIRDLLSPNPSVNGGNYNLEVMFFYDQSRVTGSSHHPVTTHVGSFGIDTIITPEIFTDYGRITSRDNQSRLFDREISD